MTGYNNKLNQITWITEHGESPTAALEVVVGTQHMSNEEIATLFFCHYYVAIIVGGCVYKRTAFHAWEQTTICDPEIMRLLS